MPALALKTCIPCRGGIPPLTRTQIARYRAELNPAWKVVRQHHLEREWLFPDFRSALAFVNRVGRMAERQGHHPDVFLAWGKVRLTLWTHKIDGLTESDMIFAAKCDRLAT